MTKRGIRSPRAQQRRTAESIVNRTAFKDRIRVESINHLSQGELFRLVTEEAGYCEWNVASQFERGEVLTDSLGRGTSQFTELAEAQKELELRGWDERQE